MKQVTIWLSMLVAVLLFTGCAAHRGGCSGCDSLDCGVVHEPCGCDTCTVVEPPCDGCDGYGCDSCLHAQGPLEHLFSHSAGCRGCGEVYWGPWISDPPDRFDPCDCSGQWIGKGGPAHWYGGFIHGFRSWGGYRHNEFPGHHQPGCGCDDCGHGVVSHDYIGESHGYVGGSIPAHHQGEVIIRDRVTVPRGEAIETPEPSVLESGPMPPTNTTTRRVVRPVPRSASRRPTSGR